MISKTFAFFFEPMAGFKLKVLNPSLMGAEVDRDLLPGLLWEQLAGRVVDIGDVPRLFGWHCYCAHRYAVQCGWLEEVNFPLLLADQSKANSLDLGKIALWKDEVAMACAHEPDMEQLPNPTPRRRPGTVATAAAALAKGDSFSVPRTWHCVAYAPAIRCGECTSSKMLLRSQHDKGAFFCKRCWQNFNGGDQPCGFCEMCGRLSVVDCSTPKICCLPCLR